MTTPRVQNPVIGTILRRIDSCSSTNDLARAMAEEGAAEGAVVVAGEQTCGRGTKGRRWYSARNQGLAFSVVLRPKNPDLTLLPLAAGLAAADAIRSVCGFEPVLKWPNDIMSNGKKLGGILIEAGSWGNRPICAILGMGMNVRQAPDDFPPEISDRAASLSTAAGKLIDGERFFRGLLDSLDVRYREFNEGRNEDIVREFQSRMTPALGEAVVLLTDAGERRGRFAGLNGRGGLIFEENEGRTVIYSGEIASVQGD